MTREISLAAILMAPAQSAAATPHSSAPEVRTVQGTMIPEGAYGVIQITRLVSAKPGALNGKAGRGSSPPIRANTKTLAANTPLTPDNSRLKSDPAPRQFVRSVIANTPTGPDRQSAPRARARHSPGAARANRR